MSRKLARKNILPFAILQPFCRIGGMTGKLGKKNLKSTTAKTIKSLSNNNIHLHATHSGFIQRGFTRHGDVIKFKNPK